MLVVMNLVRSVDAHDGLEVLFRANVPYSDVYQHPRFDPAGDTFDIESFETCKPETRGGFAAFELQREHSHSDEVAAVNPLVAFRQHRMNAQEARSFRCPIARRT